eukprot:7379422-Prymnesium_polylepis.1
MLAPRIGRDAVPGWRRAAGSGRGPRKADGPMGSATVLFTLAVVLADYAFSLSVRSNAGAQRNLWLPKDVLSERKAAMRAESDALFDLTNCDCAIT